MQTIGVVNSLTPKIEYFKADDSVIVGSFCIVETAKGVEFVKVVETNSSYEADRQIIRVADESDIKKNTENLVAGREILPRVKEIIKSHSLEMKVTKCEYTFDMEKLIIHYTAEERVDFREVVKILALEFKARIEMHQINSRDETQIMGALGCCGRVCCCKNHLSDFDKISIKMAKKQGLSLNPQKLNGICGKLLCCLKYEDDFYTEMNEKMPKVGTSVITPDGEAIVKSIDCLRESVEVIFTKDDETERKLYPLSDLQFSSVKRKDD